MVTFKCTKKECVNKSIEYNFLGNPENALCGGCNSILDPKDLRDDPEVLPNSFTS